MTNALKAALAAALLIGLQGCAVAGAGASVVGTAAGVTAGAVKTTAKVVTPGY